MATGTVESSASCNWRGQGSFSGPSAVNSAGQRLDADADVIRPVRNTSGLAIESEHAVVAAIVRLIKLSGPSAVTFFIISVVFLAFQRATRWCLSHISKKYGEVVPLWANRYAARTVAVKFWATGVFASLNHAGPYLVDRCLASPVGRHLCGGLFRIKATARNRTSAPQRLSADRALRSAGAYAKPSRAPSNVFSFAVKDG